MLSGNSDVKPLYLILYLLSTVQIFRSSGKQTASSYCMSMYGTFEAKGRSFRPKNFSKKCHYGKRPITSLELYSDFSKHETYDQLDMSQVWQHSGYPVNYESAYNFPRPVYADIPGPQPRTIEELQVERSYLLNSLQREDFKATELLRKIKSLQESCQNILEGPVHTKLKKQLGHLKNRMCQCTKQEKAILTRLGQVAYEIQSKERWNRVEYERLQQWNCFGFECMSTGVPYPGSVSQPIYPRLWSEQSTSEDNFCALNFPSASTYDSVLEKYAPTSHCGSNEVYKVSDVWSSPLSNRVRSVSMVSLGVHVEKAKRLSMPEMPMEDSTENSSTDHESVYIGYHIKSTQ